MKRAPAEKLELIDNLINKLQTRKKRIERKREGQITMILNRCGASKMPYEILAGAVLEAAKAYNQNDSRISDWQSDGLKILKPGRGKKTFID